MPAVEVYHWQDGDGDEAQILTGAGRPVLNLKQHTDEQEAGVYLPTVAGDVEDLLRALLTATGCRIVTAPDGDAWRVIRTEPGP